MTSKTTGAEWKLFYSDKEFWKDGTYHDDEQIVIDGKNASDHDIDLDAISDSAVVSISGGVVLSKDDDDIGSLENLFKKWRKNQIVTIFMVEAPNERAEEVKAAIMGAGGVILK